MAANRKDREQLDPFSMKVREKLAEHRLLVDADCWEEVSERLAAAEWRKRSVRRIGWAFTAAAAIACLLGLLRPAWPIKAAREKALCILWGLSPGFPGCASTECCYI